MALTSIIKQKRKIKQKNKICQNNNYKPNMFSKLKSLDEYIVLKKEK